MRRLVGAGHEARFMVSGVVRLGDAEPLHFALQCRSLQAQSFRGTASTREFPLCCAQLFQDDFTLHRMKRRS